MRNLIGRLRRLEQVTAQATPSADIMIIRPEDTPETIAARQLPGVSYRLNIHLGTQDNELERLRSQLRQKGYTDHDIEAIENGTTEGGASPQTTD